MSVGGRVHASIVSSGYQVCQGENAHKIQTRTGQRPLRAGDRLEQLEESGRGLGDLVPVRGRALPSRNRDTGHAESGGELLLGQLEARTVDPDGRSIHAREYSRLTRKKQVHSGLRCHANLGSWSIIKLRCWRVGILEHPWIGLPMWLYYSYLLCRSSQVIVAESCADLAGVSRPGHGTLRNALKLLVDLGVVH